jgi:hypothetical protein
MIADLFPVRDASDKGAALLALLDGIAMARAAEPLRMPATRAAALVRRYVDLLARD